MRTSNLAHFGWAIVIFALAGQNISASTVNWLYSADGNWEAVESWSSNPALPGVDDDVVINQPGLIAVRLGSSQSIRSLVCNESLTITSGTFSLAADSQINGPLVLTNILKDLTGAGNLTIAGDFSWFDGTFSGTGKTTLAATSNTALYNGSVSRVIENAGIVNFTNIASVMGRLQFANGTFNNLPAGTFNVFDNSSSSVFPAILSGTVNDKFNNAGTFNFTAPLSSTRMSTVEFNNSGTLNVHIGGFSFSGGGTNTGTINVLPAGKLAATNFTNAGVINLRGQSNNGPAVKLTGSSFANAANGKINVLSGPVLISGAGTNFGEIRIAEEAALTLTSTDQAEGSRITGPGSLALSGGIFRARSSRPAHF